MSEAFNYNQSAFYAIQDRIMDLRESAAVLRIHTALYLLLDFASVPVLSYAVLNVLRPIDGPTESSFAVGACKGVIYVVATLGAAIATRGAVSSYGEAQSDAAQANDLETLLAEVSLRSSQPPDNPFLDFPNNNPTS